MSNSHDWIDSEVAKMAQRGGELPGQSLTVISDLLRERLSVELISKTELTKIATQLLTKMKPVDAVVEEVSIEN
jgi:hypothetical protein